MSDLNSDAARGAGNRLETVALGLVFVVCTSVFGAMLGGTFVRFLMPPAADGWTGIARSLGGLMTGGLVALVVAAFLAVPLARRGTRALAIGTAAAVSAAALIALVIYLARPHRPNQGSEPPVPPSTRADLDSLCLTE